MTPNIAKIYRKEVEKYLRWQEIILTEVPAKL